MEGDTFEMEDQRNWTDASYKTYVRPLALPWPYLIAKGDAVDQTITLTVSGAAGRIESADRPLSLGIGQRVAGSFMPSLGVGLHPKDLDATEQILSALRQAKPSHLVCHYDPRFGHSAIDLQRMAALGKALGPNCGWNSSSRASTTLNKISNSSAAQ